MQLYRGDIFHDRGSSQLADRMGEGTLFGQRTGAPEGETHQANPGIRRVPPPSGAPGTGTAESGKWLVVTEFGCIKIHQSLVLAQQTFRLLSMHTHCYLAYVIDETLE